jgi:hypothetical protein
MVEAVRATQPQRQVSRQNLAAGGKGPSATFVLRKDKIEIRKDKIR